MSARSSEEPSRCQCQSAQVGQLHPCGLLYYFRKALWIILQDSTCGLLFFSETFVSVSGEVGVLGVGESQCRRRKPEGGARRARKRAVCKWRVQNVLYEGNLNQFESFAFPEFSNSWIDWRRLAFGFLNVLVLHDVRVVQFSPHQASRRYKCLVFKAHVHRLGFVRSLL